MNRREGVPHPNRCDFHFVKVFKLRMFLPMSEKVRNMFSQISPRYDLANTLLSFGSHYRWRRKAVQLTNPPVGGKLLDLACGTGDFAIAFARAFGKKGSVIATDFSEEMLQYAQAKIHGYNISLELADAMHLPFDSNMFDVCSIAFGIRNVDDPVAALREMNRVVKPNGKIVVLEFGQPRGFFGKMYRLYSRHWIPVMGGIITGNKHAYSYLQKTSADFPCGERFAALMKRAGIDHVQTKKLLFGAVYIYVGKKTEYSLLEDLK